MYFFKFQGGSLAPLHETLMWTYVLDVHVCNLHVLRCGTLTVSSSGGKENHTSDDTVKMASGKEKRRDSIKSKRNGNSKVKKRDRSKSKKDGSSSSYTPKSKGMCI